MATDPNQHEHGGLDRTRPAPTAASNVMSRRSLLKGFAVGGATVLVAGTGVVSYRVYDNGVLESGSGEPYDAWSRWRDDASPMGAVGAAILAANPHNTQPWLFHATPDSVDVFADSTRDMPAVDPLRREHHTGLGCALENLVLGLHARGYRTTVTTLPSRADQSHMARVALASGTAISTPLYEAIGDRHTNRGPYLDRTIPQSSLDDFAGLSADLPGLGVRWFTSRPEKTSLGRLLIAATEAFIGDQAQSEESFSWFRNNRDEIETHRDGPTLDGQGLDPVTLTLAKLLPASSRAAGDAFWLKQTRTVQTATAAAYGIVTVSDLDDIEARLAGGRLLQRIHLAATVRGIGLQHMNQITEQIDRERARGLPATFESRLADLLAQPGRSPLVTFRLGYPARSALRSPRRALVDVTR